jgi:hypothetical protein
MATRRKLLALAAAVAAVGATIPVAVAQAEPQPPFIPASSDWLTTVNYYRSMAGVGPVSEDPALSAGGVNHSCYMLLNGMSHDEVPGLPGYTPEGDAAGNNGNVAVSSVYGTSARSHVELWMTGPFHAIGVLRPHLQRAGFGKCDNQSTSPWRSAATLDVLRGLGPRQPMADPIVWPGNGTTTSLSRFVAESPDPRSFCGWSGGGGLPVIAMMPESVGNTVSATITGPSGPLQTCAISERNTNGVARDILGGDNAVIAMPRDPLAAGTYTVTVQTQWRTVTWSFTVDPAAANGAPVPPPVAKPVSSSLQYQAIAPTRIVDTRLWMGGGRLATGEWRRIQVAGVGSVPADAKAVGMNLTATDPSLPGFLTLWDCGARPIVSSLNYGMWETVPNSATVALDASGGVCVYSLAESDIVLDINGYYSATATNRFTPSKPNRIVDTRIGQGGYGRLLADQTAVIDVRGLAGLPADATAATMNVTSVYPWPNGYITVFACDTARPTASNLNPVAWRVRPNLVIAPLAADGTVCIYTLSDVDVVIDVTGYLSPSSPYQFQPTAPFRLVDTRDLARPEMSLGQAGRPLNPGQVLNVPMRGVRGISATAAAVSVNITAVDATTPGYVTAWPCDELPLASTTNFDAFTAAANGAQLPLSPDGSLCLYVNTNTHVIIDVNGWWQ